MIQSNSIGKEKKGKDAHVKDSSRSSTHSIPASAPPSITSLGIELTEAGIPYNNDLCHMLARCRMPIGDNIEWVRIAIITFGN